MAAALQPRTVGDKTLALAVRDYTVVLRGTETALKNHADAVKIQYGRGLEVRRELERLIKREHSAVVRIDAECHN